MRVLIQRVREARVEVAGRIVGAVGPGLVLYVGVGSEDLDGSTILPMAAKVVRLRIFPDAPSGEPTGAPPPTSGGGAASEDASPERPAGDPAPSARMNRSVLEAGGGILAVSQFTLHADSRKGRRPSFVGAAPPDRARELFDRFVLALRAEGAPVETGVFGASMQVHQIGDGPVSIWLDSNEVLARGGLAARA